MTQPDTSAVGRKVLVCGGRHFDDRVRVYAELDAVHAASPIRCIIHGGCTGADALAKAWAYERRVGSVAFYPDWAMRGRMAGPERNQRMLDVGKPAVVVAFPGGRGTADMVRRALGAGLKVIEVAAAATARKDRHA